MAIYLSFLVPKSQPLCMPCPPKARPTPVLGIIEHDKLSHFIPIASLLEWQWRQIVMRNSQFLPLSSRNRASWTTQCREIPHLLPEPFYQVLQAQVGEPCHPPLPNFPLSYHKYNKSLKDPMRGAGSTQMQIQSYRARQSGNLARKVRNAFPSSTALIS